jgi:hypothetical protein
MAVLLAVASRENMTPDEFNKVIEDPDSVTITLPEDEDTKLAYLRDMVAMMMIDGELDEQELAICKLYAMALGYRGSIQGQHHGGLDIDRVHYLPAGRDAARQPRHHRPIHRQNLPGNQAPPALYYQRTHLGKQRQALDRRRSTIKSISDNLRP